MQIVLASSSRHRQALLKRLGLPFEAHSPDVDETPLPGEGAHDLVLRLAHAKAEAVVPRHPHGIVIASDQAAVAGTRILGKPGNTAAAVAMLADLSGQVVNFLTSLVVVGPGGDARQEHVDQTRVHFRTLDNAEIQRYVALEQPLDCAGAFKSETAGILLFERIEAMDPTALVGLPLIKLGRMLRAAGVEFFHA